MNKHAVGLLIASCVLITLGVLLVFDTTSAEVLDRSIEMNTKQAFLKQMVFAVLSMIVAFGVWKVGLEEVLALSPILFWGCTFLLLIVLLPGLGQELNGAKRWIGMGMLSLQPSEILKITIPLYYAHRIQKKGAVTSFKRFLKDLGLLLVPILLVFLEPDNGTVAILMMLLIVLFFLMDVPSTYWAVPLAGLIVLGSIVAMRMPHVHDRIRVYLHPEQDILGKGHQPYQAKIAAGSGRLLGRGLGESLQKLNYLPEARSDYIAAIYAEEFGFVGISMLVFAYMLFAYLGFILAGQSVTLSRYVVASSLTFLIAFQAFFKFRGCFRATPQ